MHDTDKHCHYFNNGKNCPFEELGSTFLHELSELCKFKTCRNALFKFKRTDIDDPGDVLVKEVITDKNSDKEIKCNVCEKECMTTDCLATHLKNHKSEKEYEE